MAGGVADLVLAGFGGYYLTTAGPGLVGSIIALAVRVVAGAALLVGGVLLLRRRAAGRPVLATGAGLTLLAILVIALRVICLLYTSPSPRD